MAGIPRITRRTKSPVAATEIMAEPVDEFFDDRNYVGEICDAPATADIFPEPVYEFFDADADDDYPEPPASGETGYTVSPDDDDDDRPVMTSPLRPLPRPPTTYLDPPDPIERGVPPRARTPPGAK